MIAKVRDYGETYHLIIPKSKYISNLINKESEVYIEIKTPKDRQIHNEMRELNSLVSYGLKKNIYHGAETTALLKLYYNGAIGSPQNIEFSKDEIQKLEELLTHSSESIKKKNGRYYLTKTGVDAVQGIIIGLKHLLD
ncbi:MAG: hypothetical protein ACE5J3_01490 [Methanosarcinales archaeon]